MMEFNEDGLYFYGPAGWVFVAEIDVALNFQGNDLTKPDTLQISYTNQFSLPHTLELSQLLGSAEQIDSGGIYPYKLIPARIYEDDELIFDGRAELQSFQGGWKVAIYENERALIDQLKDKSLRDLDLNRLNHRWTLPEINARAGATSGVVYPLIDYGTIDSGIVQSDAIFPAVYVHSLIGQMLQESDYKPVGDWIDDDLYTALAIPFVEEDPKAHDEDWVAARSARVTVTPSQPRLHFGLGKGTIEFIEPYNVDNQPLSGWTDGSANNFNTTTFSYTADVPMRLHVTAWRQFRVKCDYGAVEAILALERNGTVVEQDYWSCGSFYNTSNAKTDEVKLDTYVQLKAGETVRIRFKLQGKTKIAQWNGEVLMDPDHAFAGFEPDPTIHASDDWLVALNMPDLKCWELLKTVAFLMSGWYKVDNFRRTVELVKLTDTTEDRANAVDWSDLAEDSQEPEIKFKLDPYAQRNLLKWKEQDGVDKKYGDGVIKCGVETLDVETVLFELPFSASMLSTREVGVYGTPILIETRSVKTTGTSTQIEKKSAGARLILIEPSKTFTVPTSLLNEAGNVVNTTVTLTGCWFARRPQTIVTQKNAFSLAFDPVAGQYTEASLIIRYYLGLKRLLRRPRMLSLSVYLRPRNIATLDLRRLIRIRQVRVGDLDLTDGWYVINKVNNYTSGNICTVDLIPF